jgi:FixJ family two-component response regulator
LRYPRERKAPKFGAIDFPPKSYRDQNFLDALGIHAIASVAASPARRPGLYGRLTSPEEEVRARELGITEIAVKLHLSSLMKEVTPGL